MPILSSQQIHVLENGSLYFRSLELKHSGVYICDASNGVNKVPIESRAIVSVTSLPKVTIQNTLTGGSGVSNTANSVSNLFRNHALLDQRLLLRKGSQTQLMCSAIGSESSMTVEWLRPNEKTSDENSQSDTDYSDRFKESRIVLREEAKLNEKRNYLYISHLLRMDSGIYGCLATNVNGHSVSFIDLRVQETPDSPVNFRALEVNSRTVTLTWSVGYNGNLPITSFEVQYKDHIERTKSENEINGNGNNQNNGKIITKHFFPVQ